MYKQISFNSFKDEIFSKQSLTNHMYVYLNVCKQMTDVELLLLHRYT